MPNNRFYKLENEKQELILFTSLKEFMAKNFEAASINKISKAAGLSAGALYYYFEDKEDLLNSTIEYALDGLKFSKEELFGLFEKMGYWEGITEVIRRRLEFSLQYPEKMSFIQRLILTNDRFESKGKENVLGTFRMLFDYGFDKGFINNSLPRELMFEVHLSLITSINKWELEYADSMNQINNSEYIIQNYIKIIKNAIGVSKI